MGDYADDAIDQGMSEWMDSGCPGEGKEDSAFEQQEIDDNDPDA